MTVLNNDNDLRVTDRGVLAILQKYRGKNLIRTSSNELEYPNKSVDTWSDRYWVLQLELNKEYNRRLSNGEGIDKEFLVRAKMLEREAKIYQMQLQNRNSRTTSQELSNDLRSVTSTTLSSQVSNGAFMATEDIYADLGVKTD